MQATTLAFEQQYSDNSGVQFGVRLSDEVIEFECCNKVRFPVDKLDWLIAALERIKRETDAGLSRVAQHNVGVERGA